MNYKKILTDNLDVKETYHLMISGIAPRPIAFVGSYDSNGKHNLAPYSFYNGFGANPPIVGFSPALSGRTGEPKDTLLNIQKTNFFSISLVSYSMVQQMSLSSSEYERDIDEFCKAGFDKFICSNDVPAVKGSPLIMNCSLYNVLKLGGKPASGNLILGKVEEFFIDYSVYENGKINPYKLDPVSRMGYNYYSRAKDGIFTIDKPRGLCIGIDSLPKIIRDSSILSGNDLGKLASVLKIPDNKNKNKLDNSKIDELFEVCKEALVRDEIDLAWQIVHQICEVKNV